MHRVVLALGCLLAGGSLVRADGEDSDIVRALQARFERISRAARGSVACILVARSDAYAQAPYWGVPAKHAEPGQLGGFDAAAARKRVPADAPHRARVLRQIVEHDLSRADALPESYGSGIVLDRSGLVLTNAHVVRDATRLYVRLTEGRGSWADIHASDPRSDLAVLRLLDPPVDLEPLPLGDAGKVRTGQFVLSIANAFAPGFRGSDEPTVGYGLVSNLRRRLPGNTSEMERSKITLHHYGTLIQTDARTTPGCSGGALLDLDGKVIGLTTALAGVRGDRPGGFAVPIDDNTRRIVEVLRRGEEVEYGFLGVVLQPAGALGGVRLYRISPGSPASRAGLLPGDQIVAVNDHPVRSNDDLFLYVGMALAGNTARVEVLRGPGLRQTIPVKLAKYHVEGPVVASRRPAARFGLRVDYTSLLSQRNPFPTWSRVPAEGVIIREVVPGSPADEARLQPDKVITAVNGRAVNAPAEYYREVARSAPRLELTFLTSEGRPEHLTLEEK